MTVENISLSISTKVWDRAGIELATLDLQSDTHLQLDTLPTALRCKLKYFAGKRPPVEEIYKYLDRNRKWIVQKLFSGADIELIAHALAGETYA